VGEVHNVLAVHGTVAVAVAAVGSGQVARDVVAVGHVGEGGTAVRG
jgi:2-methylaconitate cis-trans-isomerase PrpF